MKRRVMRQEDVAEFCRYLQGEERSQGTIETYRREIRAFAATLPENRVVTKEVVVAWKETLAKLADLLGHASVETTRIYIMESGAEHKRQVERLGLVI